MNIFNPLNIAIMKIRTGIFFLMFAFLLSGCQTSDKRKKSEKKFTHEELVNIVKRSYQYVAMYNVINNFAMQKGNPLCTNGWNKTVKNTKLADHTVKAIARPNNDTYYILSLLDLRDNAVIISYPAFDSKYVSVETSAYDHYVGVPLATSKGDFKKACGKILTSTLSCGYMFPIGIK